MQDGKASKAAFLFDSIHKGCVVLAGLLVFFMMLSVCYDVVARYFFNAPTVWADEISSMFLLFTPFLVGAWVLQRDGHVKMDIIVNYFNPRTRTYLNILASIIIAVICVAFVYYGVKVTMAMYEMGYRTETTLRMLKWPIIAIIPFGFFLILIQALRNMARHFASLRSSDAPPR